MKNNLATKNLDEKTAIKATATPMMQQYLSIKEAHQDCLLFYRMGDFYELFFNDAVIAAEVLDIALTKRGKHETTDIPMCGVPHHSYEPYLQKLIKSGYKVAICEQIETPEEAKKRGYKAVVRREVVRIMTPGTLIEDTLLNAKEPNYLVSLVDVSKQMALAWIDISTGEFRTSNTSKESLLADLTRLNPKEILFPDKLLDASELSTILNEFRSALTPHVSNFFESQRAESRLKHFYGVSTLDAFGEFSRAQLSCCGSLIEYIEITQKGALPRLDAPKNISPNHFMVIDAATRKNLEISTTLSGEKKGSLLSVIDYTITAPGARLLNNYIASPLTDPVAINNRLDCVQWYIENQPLRFQLRDILKTMPDMERALTRIYMQKAGPRDLAIIRDGLKRTNEIKALLQSAITPNTPNQLQNYMHNLDNLNDICELLSSALNEEVGVLARDGGFIKEGYNQGLDETRNMRDNGKNKIQELRENYRTETDIQNLKITQNNVLGYFVEVTPLNAKKIADNKFIHRQTLASAVRYTTEELRELEDQLLNAKDQTQKIELLLFQELSKAVIEKADNIAIAAQSVAAIDVLSSFAQLSEDNNYTRPTIDDSLSFEVFGGRHPVVEANLTGELESDFIANDCNLSIEQRLWLLTGPNMAGKSTFLRQNAIITLLAQTGSYVPAASARIGMVDRIFSRVGASDDLARGRSTFMVEMVETATILNQSTEKSLVILDEIGRGTATYDGLSIAWAVVEHIHNTNQCRAVFATHYHELTLLSKQLKHCTCYTMKVKEWQNEIIFMHEVSHGAADRSYGIHVAKLAGLPNPVLNRANDILHKLQESDTSSIITKLADDLPLFASANNLGTELSEIENILHNTDIDSLSPKEALELLYNLKTKVVS